MRPVPAIVPIEQLDREILNLCTRINVATYELLMLVRQFDERAGWLKWGLDNCAEWLAWRCDMSLNTAREKVRVAHALKSLPAISASFSIGELSYSKVRELTRVADANNESPLLQFALRHTASMVADRCRELRFGRTDSLDAAARAHAGRSLRVRRDANRGVTVVTVELPIAEGGLLEKALDNARDNDRCTFPGCRNRRFLHCHHVEHWSNGGETSLDNLMLLCTKHHTLVHEGGFRIERDFNHDWYFVRPDGIAVPPCGYHLRDVVDTETGEILPGERYAPAGVLLSAAERSVSEPPPPRYLH